MKKILLAITLILGVTQAIQPSYGAMFKKGALGAGTLFATVAASAIGTQLGNESMENKLNAVLPVLDLVAPKLNAALPALEALGKKESSWLGSLGTVGTIIGGTLTAYRLLQAGIGEYMGFMQILGLVNMIKGGSQVQEREMNDQSQPEQQPQGPRKLRPAQRRA